MRRLVLLIFASCCLLATGPATALAGHHHHHARHHARHHLRRFGTLATQPSQPSQPTSPTTSSPTAGTVASFSGGVLTITLNDGSTVSGMVTNDTEIECQAMGSDIARDGGPGSSGGDDSGENGGDQGDGGDDQGDDNAQACGTAALVPGATVNGAELELSASGATWSKVELG